MKKISKRFKKLSENNKKNVKFDSLEKTIDIIKNNANAKFVESIDISFKINQFFEVIHIHTKIFIYTTEIPVIAKM